MSVSGSTTQLKAQLQIALGLERKGRQFFLSAAQTTTGALAKKTFEFLAAEEEKHIARISEFYDSLISDDLEKAPGFGPSDAEERLIEITKTLVQLGRQVKPTMTDIEAYQTALEFEGGAEEFYAEQLQAATNPKVRKFYIWLIDEEAMHGRLLRSCLDFAADPESWFRQHGQD